MENKDIATVPFYVYEEEIDRFEKEYERHKEAEDKSHKTINKLIVTVVIMSILLFGGFIAHLVYESQFDQVSYSQDGKGVNNVNFGKQKDVINEPNSNDKKETQKD